MTTSIPINWTQLAKAESRPALSALETDHSNDALARASVLLGPARVIPILTSLASGFGDEVASLSPQDPTGMVRLAHRANLLASHGIEVPTQTLAALQQHLHSIASIPGIDPDDDLFFLDAAFAALAIGPAELVPVLANRDLPTVTADARFDIDSPSFVAYMAAAVASHSSYDTVESAWGNHLLYFPLKLAAHTAHWPWLLAAARAVFSGCHSQPPAITASALHKQVMQVIGAGM
jgi:hypothetical protein